MVRCKTKQWLLHDLIFMEYALFTVFIPKPDWHLQHVSYAFFPLVELELQKGVKMQPEHQGKREFKPLMILWDLNSQPSGH